MQTNKIIYWVATGLMCAIFLMSASMYFAKYEMVSGFFEVLGFPTWLIYPLAIAKLLGIVAVLTKKSRLLKEWAYAGFFYDAVLACAAHVIAADGGFGMAAVAIVAIIVSRIYDGKLYG